MDWRRLRQSDEEVQVEQKAGQGWHDELLFRKNPEVHEEHRDGWDGEQERHDSCGHDWHCI